MKKRIALTSLIAVLAILGCTKDFDEINANPNAPESITPEFLLTNVISTAADRNAYEQGFRLANYLAQFAASVEFERIDRYEMGSNSNYWNTLYSLLNDLESMKESPGVNEAYLAVGDIMRCHLFSQLTDMWGDVPYREALRAKEGLFSPKYDSQEFIYTDSEVGLLAVLKKSVETLQSTNSSIRGDVMFNNDLQKWIRFANSLRIRYLLRISGRVDVSTELSEVVNSGTYMLSNADNAVVPYLSAPPNQFPMFFASLGLYQEHRMTRTVDSILELWNDPRVSVLYKFTAKSVDDSTFEYVGLQNGLNRETIAERNIDLRNVSLFGSIFRDVPDGVDAQFMQFAELQFALAEAAERGLIVGNADNFYEEGIRASFAYYGVAVPSDYFVNPAVNLGTGNRLEKILTQKWLSLINVGHEAWFNVRRTGIPNLQPGPDNLNNDMYPVRYLYPESEQATNQQNYAEAASRMGGDNINSKGWWEQ